MSYSLSFSKAIMVVVFISDKIRQGMFEFLSTRTISQSLDIPKPTLVKILGSLTRVGIIETKEGKNGGIRLSKQPKNISILEIFEAIEEGKPMFHTNINIVAKGKRPDNAKKSVATILNQAEQQMKNTLSTQSVQDILNTMS
ncbi:MAG: Rrf2 family transcriptional regulator [Reichenbachiella sp.]